MVESEELSEIAAQDLRATDIAVVRALIAIGVVPLFCIFLVIPLQIWWIDFWLEQHITAFAVVDFMQIQHRVAGRGFVSTSSACKRSYWGDISGVWVWRRDREDGLRCRP